jgi:hypothetical protein
MELTPAGTIRNILKRAWFSVVLVPQPLRALGAWDRRLSESQNAFAITGDAFVHVASILITSPLIGKKAKK